MSPQAERREGGISLTLERFEFELLESLPTAIRRLVEDPDPDDVAFARLFPTCVPDDDEEDAEVRRLIFDDLLAARLEAVDEVAAILERNERGRRGTRVIDLDDEESGLVLGVVNDVRLTLGARVGIERLDRDEVDADHPAAPTLAVMDHLAWIQEELLAALDPSTSTGT
jgi:hypothetical protein